MFHLFFEGVQHLVISINYLSQCWLKDLQFLSHFVKLKQCDPMKFSNWCLWVCVAVQGWGFNVHLWQYTVFSCLLTLFSSYWPTNFENKDGVLIYILCNAFWIDIHSHSCQHHRSPKFQTISDPHSHVALLVPQTFHGFRYWNVDRYVCGCCLRHILTHLQSGVAVFILTYCSVGGNLLQQDLTGFGFLGQDDLLLR